MNKVKRQEITIYSIPKVHIAVYRSAATQSGETSISSWMRKLANDEARKQCPKLWEVANHAIQRQKGNETPFQSIQTQTQTDSIPEDETTAQEQLEEKFLDQHSALIETPFNPTTKENQ